MPHTRVQLGQTALDATLDARVTGAQTLEFLAVCHVDAANVLDSALATALDGSDWRVLRKIMECCASDTAASGKAVGRIGAFVADGNRDIDVRCRVLALAHEVCVCTFVDWTLCTCNASLWYGFFGSSGQLQRCAVVFE